MYAITVSPSLRAIRPEILYQDDVHNLRRLLNQCSHHFILYPEFDSTSRLHYHGVVQIDDLIKLHRIKYKFDRIGFTKVTRFKTFRDHLTYLLYCQKEFAVTSQLFEPVLFKCLKRVPKSTINKELDVGIMKWCVIVDPNEI